MGDGMSDITAKLNPDFQTKLLKAMPSIRVAFGEIVITVMDLDVFTIAKSDKTLQIISPVEHLLDMCKFAERFYCTLDMPRSIVISSADKLPGEFDPLPRLQNCDRILL